MKQHLDAEAHIWNYAFASYNAMALKCALELGIPDAIQKHGNPMTVQELANTLAIDPNKAPCLYRLMRFLVHNNFFTTSNSTNNNSNNVDEEVFGLNPNSQALLQNNPFSLAPFALSMLDTILNDLPSHFTSWFKSEHYSPVYVAHGKSLFEHAACSPTFNENYNRATACDSRSVSSILLANDDFKRSIEGLESLVDVAGGDGTMARAIAEAYPNMKCVAFDLPHVVEGLQGNGTNLVYVAGDMFQGIPPADGILLKWILHDWSDEHCIKILEQCKEAITRKHNGGKLVVIDIVLNSHVGNPDHFKARLLCDMVMMGHHGWGKERTEVEWKDLFLRAGFSTYKILPILGSRCVIEVYI